MKILDQEILLKKNVLDSFKIYKVFWLLLLLSELFDAISTIAFMHDVGIDYEANEVILWLSKQLGVVSGVFFGKFLQFIAAMSFSALSLKYSRAILLLFITLNVLATLHNL